MSGAGRIHARRPTAHVPTRALLAIVWLAAAAGCALPGPVRVVSFNIRYGTAPDGENAWPARRELVFQTLRDCAADIAGLQEVLAFQLQELRDALPEYHAYGVGRDDGARRGEMTPILYRHRRFLLAEAGHFWLSEQPEQPGSRGWDAALPRIATWVRLKFRSNPLNELYVINTHLDHRGQRARLESARLLRRLVDSLGGLPIIVLGDFNCGPGSPPYQVLTADTGNAGELRDSYAVLARPEHNAGTYHAFRGDTSGPRIDWILCNRRFDVRDADILRSAAVGLPGMPASAPAGRRNQLPVLAAARPGAAVRYASDHFAVIAVLQILPATASGVL